MTNDYSHANPQDAYSLANPQDAPEVPRDIAQQRQWGMIADYSDEDIDGSYFDVHSDGDFGSDDSDAVDAAPEAAAEPAVVPQEAIGGPEELPEPAYPAMALNADVQEIVDQAAAMADLGTAFVGGVRRSSRASRPTDFYVHPDHADLILEGEDVDDVLADFDADSDAEAAMETESDSDSDYDDY